MKKKLIVALMLAALMVGCGQQESNESVSADSGAVASDSTADTSETESVIDNIDLEDRDAAENAAMDDYSDTIKNDISKIANSATSIQDEIAQVEAMVSKYQDLVSADVSQTAMNMASQWPGAVWDAELNSLWSRMSNNLDASTKESTLADLRKWNAMKEDIIVSVIGTADEGGSIYPMTYQNMMQNMTMRKTYQLAKIYAEALGQSFTMPECGMYGVYIDDQGTSDIYGELSITEEYSGDTTAEIALYRITTLEGSVEKKGDDLIFGSYDGDVTGTITYGWDGATFTVDSCTNGIVEVGDKYEFDTVF